MDAGSSPGEVWPGEIGGDGQPPLEAQARRISIQFLARSLQPYPFRSNRASKLDVSHRPPPIVCTSA